MVIPATLRGDVIRLRGLAFVDTEQGTTSLAEEMGVQYCCKVTEDPSGVEGSAGLKRARRFGGGVRVRSIT